MKTVAHKAPVCIQRPVNPDLRAIRLRRRQADLRETKSDLILSKEHTLHTYTLTRFSFDVPVTWY